MGYADSTSTMHLHYSSFGGRIVETSGAVAERD
nr:MAG TPA: hypothetical protein [Caudoviricetes sp.]